MAPKKQEQSEAPKLPPLWERLQGQIDWYDRKATANQHAYKASKIAITCDGAFLNGKIVEGWDNWDQLGLMVQIGAVPAAQFVAPTQERRTA